MRILLRPKCLRVWSVRPTGYLVSRTRRCSFRSTSAIIPDLWQIGYAVTKRPAGRAPEGVPVARGLMTEDAKNVWDLSRT
jgi:hypothetical protein